MRRRGASTSVEALSREPAATRTLDCMDGLFDTIAGLPVHPLIVHAAVVLLPLAALGLLAAVVRPAWRERFGPLVLAGLVAGAVAAVIAEESGEALAERVGMPSAHAEWGERLVPAAMALAVVAVTWFVVTRRRGSAAGGGALPTMLGGLAALLALAVMGLTVVAGHSGATAAWADRVSASSTPGTSSGEPAASTSPTPSGSPTATASGSEGAISLAQVAQHAGATSCWAAIGGSVYDLTSWIGSHPGGEDKILRLCGTDGTGQFTEQHGSSEKVANRLAGFRIGALG